MDFIVKKKHAGIFLAPGLGKTLIYLTALQKMREQGVVDKVIIVAKKRIIYTVWPKEIKKWGFSDLKVCTLHGSKKDKAFEEDADVYLINREGLPWLRKKMKPVAQRRRFQGSALCVDESTMFKNTKSGRFRAIKPMLKLFSSRVIMTGSPSPNGMVQLYGQIYIVDMGRSLGEHKTQFFTRYFYPSGYMGYDWTLQDGAEERIYNAIRNIVIHFGKDEIELPPLLHNPIIVQLPDSVMATYKELERDFITLVEKGVVVASNSGVASGKLRQLASGHLYVETGAEALSDDTSATFNPNTPQRVVEVVHSAKIEALQGLVEELQDSPCLVAYQWNHELEELRKAFPDAPFIGGATSTEDGIAIEDAWNNGELPVLFGQAESIAHGLNLQESGCDLVIFSMSWDLEVHEQLIQRLWRQGQQNAVTVHYLIAENTVDEVMLDVMDSKDIDQRMLLEAMEQRYYEREGGLNIMSKTIKALISVGADAGLSMPQYGKDSFGRKQHAPEQYYVTALCAMLSKFSHNEHRRFIENATGHLCDIKDLVGLYGESKKLIFKAFDITGTNEGGYNVTKDAIAMFKKYSKTKPKGVVVDPVNDEEYLSMEGKSKFAEGGAGSKPTKKEKSMKKKATTKKKAAAKKPVAKKKATTKKKVAAKKPVAKKKTAVKKSAAITGKIVVGSKKVEKGIHGELQAAVGKGAKTLDAVYKLAAKKLSHEKAGDEKFVLGYIKGGIRRGYLKEV